MRHFHASAAAVASPPPVIDPHRSPGGSTSLTDDLMRSIDSRGRASSGMASTAAADDVHHGGDHQPVQQMEHLNDYLTMSPQQSNQRLLLGHSECLLSLDHHPLLRSRSHSPSLAVSNSPYSLSRGEAAVSSVDTLVLDHGNSSRGPQAPPGCFDEFPDYFK